MGNKGRRLACGAIHNTPCVPLQETSNFPAGAGLSPLNLTEGGALGEVQAAGVGTQGSERSGTHLITHIPPTPSSGHPGLFPAS